ncbi:MAG: hypothetical protein LBL90_12375 [Prevotellaceae bacterium]|nr:hypothetical protein [Prevotellaceae bacterium]
METAFQWYKKAAEQGYASAQNSLANCYYYGEGVAKNIETALVWYKKPRSRDKLTRKKRWKKLPYKKCRRRSSCRH